MTDNANSTGEIALGLSERDATAQTIARILSGEPHLFHALIQPVERPVFLMLYMLLRDETDAEDAAQETFIKVYRNLHNFRGDSKFSTWVLSITRNEGLGWLRKRASRPEEPLEPVLDESGGDFTPALLTDWREIPSETLERNEVREHLQKAIERLPLLYRTVLVMRDMEGLDMEETARSLCVTTTVVKVRLHRARRMMQRDLAPLLKRYAPKGKGWLGGWS